MKTGDLRIGNYVTIDNPNSWLKMKDIPLEVTGVNNIITEDEKKIFAHSDGKVWMKSDYETFGQFSQFIQPIYLTVDWLVAFGFNWNESWGCFVKNGYFVEKIGDLLLDRKYGKVIKYVHNLQNLYLIITDKELKLNK